MKTLELYEVVFGAVGLSTKDELIENLLLIDVAHELSPAAIATLTAAFKAGPLDDGDVPSKSGRDELVAAGLVAKTITKGEWGGNACTYKGAWAFKILEATGA